MPETAVVATRAFRAQGLKLQDFWQLYPVGYL